MAYSTATRSFTMQDDGGSLDWITDSFDPAETQMTDEEISAWADQLISQQIEHEGYELEKRIELLSFPMMGYSTTQIFQDEDEYRAFKLEEIETDLRNEQDMVIAHIKAWIAG